jgi:hypothetical protein
MRREGERDRKKRVDPKVLLIVLGWERANEA